MEVLGRLLLLVRREPGVRPDDLHLRARMRLLHAESERVRVPDHLGNRERDDVADGAGLRRCACGDAGEVDRVLTGAVVLGHVLLDDRAGRHLELDVRVLLRRRCHRRLVAERRREDDLVAVTDQAVDHLGDLRALRDVLLVGRLHLRAERLLHREPALVVRLRPAAVVVRADVDPRGLERRVRLRRTGRRADGSDDGDRRDREQDRGEREFPLGQCAPLLEAWCCGGWRRIYPTSRSASRAARKQPAEWGLLRSTGT